MLSTTNRFPGGSVTHVAMPGGGGDTGNTALFSAPGQFAGAMGNVFGGFGQGMAGVGQGLGALGQGYGQAIGGQANAYAGMGNATAANYGAFSSGQAALGNAMANERAAAYGAMAQSEAARQLAAGNIANQSLASYGGMGNAAMAAWAQNQSSYNQAMQNIAMANQVAAGQLGQSRNQALGGLGDSISSMSGRMAAANILGDMDLGGGGFEASGPGGAVASGSFGATGGGSRRPGLGALSEQGFGALDNLRRDIMDNTFLDSLNAARTDGYDRLDAQHYSSRNMPFDQMRLAAGDLRDLAAPGYSALRQGMDQFYGNMNDNRADFSPFRESLDRGFQDSSRDLRDLGGRMSDDYRHGMEQMGGVLGGLTQVGSRLGSGMSTTQNAIQRLFDNSLGNMPVFQTPARRVRNAQAAQAARRTPTRARPATNPVYLAANRR